jgi:hypothetical protein
MFPVRYGQTYRVELSFNSRVVTVILIDHRHKPIDLEMNLHDLVIPI